MGNMDEIMNKLFRQKGFEASAKDLRCEMLPCCAGYARLRACNVFRVRGSRAARKDDRRWWQPWHPCCSCART